MGENIDMEKNRQGFGHGDIESIGEKIGKNAKGSNIGTLETLAKKSASHDKD
jgi:hypothetical protein